MDIRTPDQRLRVFVSSTLEELADERRAVSRAISALRLVPVMFEQGARPHPPQEVYRSYLAQSDVFIGLYWQRYGWIGHGMKISGLEDEFGLSRELPRLLYVKAPAPGREPALAKLLDRIREEATASYRTFHTPAELARLVRDDLAVLLSERFTAGRPAAEAPSPAGAQDPGPLPVSVTSLVGRDIDEGVQTAAVPMADRRITVYLADDNLIVREGVRALIAAAPDLVVVGTAADYDSLIAGAAQAAPQVLVTDIRMPPTFQREGIEAAKVVRKAHPGTGVVVLSNFDEPDYAISLLSEGAAGLAYLLKDRIAEGDQLVRAIREVSSGGSMLDPLIVEALVRPASQASDLTPSEESLLQMLAEGKPIKAIAVARRSTPAAVSDDIDALFLKLAQAATAGAEGALRRLKLLHQAIVNREEQGESLSRLLPTGLAEKLRTTGRRIGETETLTVTVLISDVRGYSGIAETADPTVLAGQLNEHRAKMNGVILGRGGTVMQFVGDSVMAVFGAPWPQADHADQAVSTAVDMHAAQAAVNEHWAAEGLPPFCLGIGLSTGVVAAALLGSAERVEYSLVGDSVNLAQRLQQLAAGGETILSEPTMRALTSPVSADVLPPATLKGRHTPVTAYRLAATASATQGAGAQK